jgi:hypothetical protein
MVVACRGSALDTSSIFLLCSHLVSTYHVGLGAGNAEMDKPKANPLMSSGKERTSQNDMSAERGAGKQE